MLDLVFSNNEPPALNETNLNAMVNEINNKVDTIIFNEEIERIDGKVDEINETLLQQQDAIMVDIADEASFKVLTTQPVSGRYGFEWLNMPKGKYILTFRTNGAVYYGGYANNTWYNQGQIVNDIKTVEINMPVTGSICIWNPTGVTSLIVSELKLLSEYVGNKVDNIKESLSTFTKNTGTFSVDGNGFIGIANVPNIVSAYCTSRNDIILLPFRYQGFTELCVLNMNTLQKVINTSITIEYYTMDKKS